MGALDYRGLPDSDVTELMSLTHDLAAYSILKSIARLPVGEIIEGLSDFVGDGFWIGNHVDTGLPDGWREVSAEELGLPAELVDNNGYLKIKSPVTGFTETGPQVLILAEEGPDGSITRVSISYVATNSPVDVADFFFLNSGTELAAAMEPILSAVADYTTANGLDGDDVIVTGYSLGGGMTNIQARYADTMLDGFYANSVYVGHAAPVIYDDSNRVLNIGFENDVIHRAAGDWTDFWSALAAADPLLSNNDANYATSLDNAVIFDGAYAHAEWTLAVDSILNPLSWWAHITGIFTDAVDRIGSSVFYEFTHQDSVMVISALGTDLRGNTWVEDKPAPTSDHFGAPAFIIGTEFADKLSDGDANDWLEGNAGNDLIRVSEGLNRVDGGAGTDTLRVLADPDEVDVYRLTDGTLVVDSGDGLTVANNVEKVEIGHTGLLGLHDWVTEYSIKGDRLEDEHWSLFEWGDKDIAYSHASTGTDGNDHLTGSALFGQGGDDILFGTNTDDLIHGGEGADALIAGAGDDRLYGAEHDDYLLAGSGTDRLNGGHGNDVFIFDAAQTGTAIVEDFNDNAGEVDELLFIGGDAAAALASAEQKGHDVWIHHGNMNVVLQGTTLADLDNVLLA